MLALPFACIWKESAGLYVEAQYAVLRESESSDDESAASRSASRLGVASQFYRPVIPQSNHMHCCTVKPDRGTPVRGHPKSPAPLFT